MEHALFSFLLVFIGWILFHAGMHMLFPSRWKTVFVFLATIGASALAFLLDLLLPAFPWIWMTAAGALLILSAEYCFQGIPGQKRICAAILFPCIMLCAHLGKLQMFPEESFSGLMRLPLSAFLCFLLIFYFIGFLFLCLFVMSTQAFLRRKGNALSSRWFLFLLLPLSQFFLMDRTITPDTMAGGWRQPAMLAGVILLAFLANQMIITAINSIVRNREAAVRYEALSHQIRAKETYYRKLASHYERIQYLRHDLNNHVSALKILLEKNDREELVSYLESLKRTNLFEDLPSFCGHPVANLFLAEQCAEMKENGIRLDTDLVLGEETDSGSLLLALESLLNYAVQNLADVPEKTVFLSSDRDDQGLILTVSFPVKDDPEKFSIPSGELKNMSVSVDRDPAGCSVRLTLREVPA